MFPTSIAGSLLKPGWLAETRKRLLEGKDVMVGVIDVASDERLFPCTGLALMDGEVARRKLEALAQGAEPARRRYA